jgi:hypothetical protein
MESKLPPTATVASRAVHELLQYAYVSAYLYVCFGAILLYKTAILKGEGVSYLPYGVAVIKALILGKFILIGHAVGLGDRYQLRRRLYVIIHKSLLFLVMLLVLSIVEEVVVGLVHGQTAAASLAAFGGGTLVQVLAECAVMLLILIPYVAFRELNEAMGEGKVLQILLEPHAGHRGVGAESHQATVLDPPRGAK